MGPEVRERLKAWVSDRYPVKAIRDFAAHKVVPVHRGSLWYYFGGMALFLFIVQVITGSLLLLYYRPSSAEAYESVQFIMTKVSFGWLVRSLHAWSANLMVFFLFVHMFSCFFLKTYRKPRELTWVSGCLLFGVTLALGFSGYLLPWNTISFFATQVGTEIARVVPVVGEFIVLVLRGGTDVTGATLTRFYAWHIAMLPGILAALLLVHLAFIQSQGMSIPLGVQESRRNIPFIPNFLLREVLAWTLTLGILATLAAYFPTELGAKADPFSSAPADIKPEWYFLFPFQTLKLIPATILGIEGEALGVLAITLGGIAWILVPFLDRKSSRGESSPLFTMLGVLVLVFVVGMTIWGGWPA